MDTLIVPAVVGMVLIVIGILNMKGNISTLHWYHRQRVAKEDLLPFGRKVGLGTIIIGVAVIIKAVLDFMADKMGNELFVTLGNAAMIGGLVIGIAFIVRAMLQYNKGIF